MRRPRIGLAPLGIRDENPGRPARLPPPKPRPEILAPAGDRDALAAALAAGADAVYLGLDDGFNARARAANFASADLPELVAWVHRAGARVYVTLNTLVFEPELPIVEELVRRVAAAGADAIIVQDPAVALIARQLCPALEVHASTQMTASGPLAAELLAPLGLTRIVAPRELSIEELRAYRDGLPAGVDLEVFVHGALCVAWSGQCLSSEAWGGRSANRGQCAQACRLPYQLVIDGAARDLGDVEYLLSPKDLDALELVPELAAAGVASLKIEGRLKGPAYVATAVAQYRRAAGGEPAAPGEPAGRTVDDGRALDLPLDRDALTIAYSRGGSPGFLGGADHQRLVEGRFPRHRGLPLGRVLAVEPPWVVVAPDPAQRPVTGGRALTVRSPDGPVRGPDGPVRGPDGPVRGPDAAVRAPDVRAGMGVVFERGRPELPEEGGPIFEVMRDARGVCLRFGTPGPDLEQVRAGDFVWISSDPRVTRAGERAAAAGREPLGRVAVELAVAGAAGAPLEVRARAAGHEVVVRTRSPLAPARGTGLTGALLADKLGALGGTAFHLAALDAGALAPGLHVPVSELKELRRAFAQALDERVATVERSVAPGPVVELVRARVADPGARDAAGAARVVPLCRDDAQLDAVLEAGADEVELDWMELVGLGRAAERARRRGAKVTLATVRVQKPGEERIDAHLARLQPDAVLVRSWGALAYFARAGVPRHGDFSLNVTNSITAGWVLAHGLDTITAAHDLDREQLLALLEATPRGRIAVTIHHHIPTFHTEHCVYAHLMSTGRDYRSCGRPCEQHQIALRDRVGLVHPVLVDVGCRNTVFNAQAQSAAHLVPELVARGVRRFRVELVRESGAEAARIYTAYAELVAGALAPAEVVQRVAAHEQFGVTRGTMRTLTVLR